MIQQHFLDNNIVERANLHLRVINKGVSSLYGGYTIPRRARLIGEGSLRTEQDVPDYRGLEGSTVAIETCSVSEILANFSIIDLVHFDIQGSKFDAIKTFYKTILSKVKVMVVGTHSRVLADFLHQDWRIVYEKPCKFDRAAGDTITLGSNIFDGTQVWLNKLFAAQ